MELHELEKLINETAQGLVSPEEAISRLRREPFTDLGYAKTDNHRGIRQGVAEVIYGESKTPEQIIGICNALKDAGQKRVLITRLDQGVAFEVSQEVPLVYRDECSAGIVGEIPEPSGNGAILVAAAGTSDLRVAEEAALTAEVLGNKVVRLYDVGVAGIHRLLAHTEDIMNANVIIAVAGMEGALPSVVAGMASAPVIAVPTSVGYGASFNGVAALLAMLNSCASGVSVVNIDNGFGAGYQASLINHAKVLEDGKTPSWDFDDENAEDAEILSSEEIPVLENTGLLTKAITEGSQNKGGVSSLIPVAPEGDASDETADPMDILAQASEKEAAVPVAKPEEKAADVAGGPTFEPPVGLPVEVSPETPAPKTLHFDLTHNATRKAILGTLLAQIDEEGFAALSRKLELAGVPNKHHGDFGEVLETVDNLCASEKVKADMRTIYYYLAEAEAQAHNCAIEETHFHEVGNAEAIENALQICFAFESLSPDKVTATPVQIGSGSVVTSHGVLNIPAPATTHLLASGIPVYSKRYKGELCTPTSAAIIKHFVDEYIM